MIARVSKPATDFRRLIDYTMNPTKDHILLGSNMRGETAQELAGELDDWRTFNERVGKPVFHASLSAAAEDRLTASRWLDVAEIFLRRLGYGDSPWVVVRHRDRDHDHVHLIACRIDSRGRCVKSFRQRTRSQVICNQIEREQGLTATRAGHAASVAPMGEEELAAFAQTGAVSIKARLRGHLDLAARGQPTMTLFVERLEAQGVEVRAHFAPSGRVDGISCALAGLACRGSRLGRGYSWKGLQDDQGIAFEPARDLPALRAATARATLPGEARQPQIGPLALVPRPALPPRPEPARTAAAFRQAAVIEARADVERRREALIAELDAVRSGGGPARPGLPAAGDPRAARALAALERLPDLAALHGDVLRAGRALGEETVRALAPRAAEAFAAAKRFFGLTGGGREVWRRGSSRDVGRPGEGPDTERRGEGQSVGR
jgi:Relaxase/Mobilisation nuclease domain